MKRLNKSMLDGPLLPNIILYTIPVILTNILQILFNSADMIIVGRFCGSISLAAVGATASICELVVNLFIGLSIGTGVTVAQNLGRHDDSVVHRTVHTALPTAIICGGALTVVSIFSAEYLLTITGTPDTVLDLATTYIQIYFTGIIFTLIYNFCASILRAVGDTKSPLIFLAIAGTINVGLNVLFITVFQMNVAGVALATVISQGISAALVVIALTKRKDICRLEFQKIRIYRKELGKIIKIGIPAGLQSSLFAVSNIIIQSSVNSFGSTVMSGHAAAGNIESFVYVISNAFYQAAVNFVGQNTGARNFQRVRKVFLLCLSCGAIMIMAVSALALSFNRELLSIYITDSETAIQYGLLRMKYMMTPYFTFCLMEVTTGALRGIGKSLLPMFSSVLGICGLRITWVYTVFQIPQFHSMKSLYVSYVTSWIITFLINLTIFLVVFRRLRKSVPISPKHSIESRYNHEAVE